MDLKNIQMNVMCNIDHKKADKLIEEFKQSILNECITINIEENKRCVIKTHTLSGHIIRGVRIE